MHLKHNPMQEGTDGLVVLAFLILEAGELLEDGESPSVSGLADLMRDALQRAGAVDIIRMTSCMQEWFDCARS